MSDYTLKLYTREEYQTDMQKLLNDKGLYDAVKQYCDEIDEYASALSYTGHRGVQECLENILYLVEQREAAMRGGK